MTEPLDHVLRPALPWRDQNDVKTECGRALVGLSVLSRDAAQVKWKKQGQARAALTTCMTCLQTAQRWPSWDEDPARSLGREHLGAMWAEGDPRLNRELRAIALLIDAHREEFDATVRGLEDVGSLDDARKRKKGAR